ncbi:MAG: radical SAM protein [Clostridia bacterium]|nr:radical SAM protein [Clostridia bacterium]
MSFSDTLKSLGLQAAYSYLDKDPDKNIPRLLAWVDKLDTDNKWASQRVAFHNVIDHPDNNWYRLIRSFWTDCDPGVRKTIFNNFFINANIKGCAVADEIRDREGCNIPWAILLDPTSACNLHCTGCWAAEYGDKLNMSYDTMDEIVRQAKAMGVYMFLFTGGEPLVRKKDLIRLCEAHSDCAFLSFTNGTLIDDQFADDMLRVKNFYPAISIEGFEEDTDFRRGKGTYRAIIAAMERLKARKLPFGISCCYTSKNVDTIGSEEYFDYMIEMGAKFAWFFTYMPVGNAAVPELIAKPEQREFMYHQIRKFRHTKPIFTMDFWNDGEFVGGCIAGGRKYLHINAAGDIEPCAFIHYSDSNIHEKTLLEAFKSPLFMAYKHGQPFNENLLRPCPLLDNPEKLRGIVHETGAHSTDLESPEDIDRLADKCENAAAQWAPVADELWAKGHHEIGHNEVGAPAGE